MLFLCMCVKNQIAIEQLASYQIFFLQFEAGFFLFLFLICLMEVNVQGCSDLFFRGKALLNQRQKNSLKLG